MRRGNTIPAPSPGSLLFQDVHRNNMPGTLARRGYGALFSPMRGGRYRTAYKTAKYVYANRAKVKRAARTIGRAYRSYRKSRAGRLSGATATSEQWSTAIANTDATMNALNRKTLLAQRIEFCRPPAENNAIGAAPYLTFGVKGIKFCGTFSTGVMNLPTKVHMAIVQAKEPNIEDTKMIDEMFRTTNSTVDKYVNYINFTTDPTWDPMQDCRTLSKEKFNIVTHMRIKLNPGGWGNSVNQRYYHFEKYFNLKNKKFQFEAGGEEIIVDKPLWILLWHETMVGTNSTAEILYHINTQTYLSKPRLGF